MKRHQTKIIFGASFLIILVALFWWGGNAPSLRGWPVGRAGDAPVLAQENTPLPQTEQPAVPLAASLETAAAAGGLPDSSPPAERAAGMAEQTAVAKPAVEDAEPAEAEATATPAEPQASDAAVEMQINPSTGKDQYLTEPVPEGKPAPIEPQDAVISDAAYSCTLSVRCDSILNHLDWLKAEKLELVPADGVIFPATSVTFYEGESVFNVLTREMKRAGIHLEFVNTPIYNSAYIEGIHNLYEFDCGELSGWMYQVNGWFPNYGCSRYQLQPGDQVEWVFTCDLGVDVGGYYAAGGQAKDQ